MYPDNCRDYVLLNLNNFFPSLSVHRDRKCSYVSRTSQYESPDFFPNILFMISCKLYTYLENVSRFFIWHSRIGYIFKLFVKLVLQRKKRCNLAIRSHRVGAIVRKIIIMSIEKSKKKCKKPNFFLLFSYFIFYFSLSWTKWNEINEDCSAIYTLV